MKLHQLKNFELMQEMTKRFDVYEGFLQQVEFFRSPKTASLAYPNLSNNATLSCIGVEVVHSCSLFDKSIIEWEDLEQECKTWS